MPSKKKVALGIVGALAVAGTACVATSAAHSRKLEPPATQERPFVPSPKRLARREAIDRSDMQAVYDAKPISFKIGKRFFDIVLSGAALVALSPLFAATAAAIVAEDGRPVFYRSVRPGKDMKPFGMLKFRSMRKDADQMLDQLLEDNEQTGAAFKMKDDPRITRIGKYIRKYSIDELPQLVNILKGDMSIVGPRAIVPTHEFNEHERQRHIIQPGLTCYWQTKGRTAIPWEEWVELDLDYIQDMGMKTDVELIVDTLPVVFNGDGE